MKTFVCTGDSHTWGQGADGALNSVVGVVGGERRPLPFSVRCYVNEVRRGIECRTNSRSFEILSKDMTDKTYLDCAMITASLPYSFSAEAEIISIFYYADNKEQGIKVMSDGVLVASDMPTRYGTELSYNRLIIHTCPGNHKITILPTDNEAYLYRIEGYSGECAVINSGIGSCPSFRYLNEHWKEAVDEVKPDFAIVEPHTINDWLSPQTPDEYYVSLMAYFNRLKVNNISAIMLTVAPIFGPTARPFSDFEFSAYMEMAKKAAVDSDVVIVDAHKVLSDKTEKFSETEKFSLIADDNWHPNTYGHLVYAEEIIKTILNLGWI